MPARLRIGPSATTVCMVVQLGLATMPLWPSRASGFTSETTSGTSSCIRHWEELSTTTAPASANRGAQSALTSEPAEKRATSKPWIDSSFSGWTESLPSPHTMPRPAERSEANGTTSSAGNERSRRTSSIVAPTAPVAPTTATRTLRHLRAVHARHVLGQHGVGAELERGVQLPHGLLHVLLAHDAGDLDRRGGDHLDVHPGFTQHGEGLGGHTRMALHSGTDDGDLPHAVVRLHSAEPKLGPERLERLARGCHVLARDRERHVGQVALRLRLVLDDHVHVDVPRGKRREHAARDAGLVRKPGEGDPRLRGRVRHGCDERSFHCLLLVLDHRTGSIVEA